MAHKETITGARLPSDADRVGLARYLVGRVYGPSHPLDIGTAGSIEQRVSRIAKASGDAQIDRLIESATRILKPRDQPLEILEDERPDDDDDT